MIRIILILALLICYLTNFGQQTETYTDTRDGKVYKTITIGTQTWMAENLAYKTTSGCWAYNDSESNAAIYGYIYDWETAQKVCPKGWHLPTYAEWKTLTNYLGGDKVAGGKLKESGTLHWQSPNNYATNISGFTALPGGYRSKGGRYYDIGFYGGWWSAPEGYAATVVEVGLIYYSSEMDWDTDWRRTGFYVRCIKN